VSASPDTLAAGIAKLSATKLPDGRFAYFDDGMRRWYVVTETDVVSLIADYVESARPNIAADAYSHWCARTQAEEMPDGWEPSE
jgi:hypothetical protein